MLGALSTVIHKKFDPDTNTSEQENGKWILWLTESNKWYFIREQQFRKFSWIFASVWVGGLIEIFADFLKSYNVLGDDGSIWLPRRRTEILSKEIFLFQWREQYGWRAINHKDNPIERSEERGTPRNFYISNGILLNHFYDSKKIFEETSKIILLKLLSGLEQKLDKTKITFILSSNFPHFKPLISI